jgi:hypothetical protein
MAYCLVKHRDSFTFYLYQLSMEEFAFHKYWFSRSKVDRQSMNSDFLSCTEFESQLTCFSMGTRGNLAVLSPTSGAEVKHMTNYSFIYLHSTHVEGKAVPMLN